MIELAVIVTINIVFWCAVGIVAHRTREGVT